MSSRRTRRNARGTQSNRKLQTGRHLMQWYAARRGLIRGVAGGEESSQRDSASGFAAILRQRRIDAGLTQAVLAERAGLSLRGIQHLEAAAGAPYPDTARRLADALGLTGDTRGQFASAARPTAKRRDRAGRHP